jgi:glutathione S-transferase
VFIQELEDRLSDSAFLMSNQESLADIALVPFIRQFAKVERQWYLQSPYPRVRLWLNFYLQSGMFTRVMGKFEVWRGE